MAASRLRMLAASSWGTPSIVSDSAPMRFAGSGWPSTRTPSSFRSPSIACSTRARSCARTASIPASSRKRRAAASATAPAMFGVPPSCRSGDFL